MGAPEDYAHNLTNHAPGPRAIARMEAVRPYAKDLAAEIIISCPASRERALALTNLEQATMWAMAAIAWNQEGG